MSRCKAAVRLPTLEVHVHDTPFTQIIHQRFFVKLRIIATCGNTSNINNAIDAMRFEQFSEVRYRVRRVSDGVNHFIQHFNSLFDEANIKRSFVVSKQKSVFFTKIKTFYF